MCFVCMLRIHVQLSSVHFLFDERGSFHLPCPHVAFTANKASRANTANKEPHSHVIGGHRNPLTNYPTLPPHPFISHARACCGTNMAYPPLPNKPTLVHDQFPPTVQSHGLYPLSRVRVLPFRHRRLPRRAGSFDWSWRRVVRRLSPVHVPDGSPPSHHHDEPPSKTPPIMKHKAVPDPSLVNAFAGLQTLACMGVGCMRRQRRIGRIRYIVNAPWVCSQVRDECR